MNSDKVSRSGLPDQLRMDHLSKNEWQALVSRLLTRARIRKELDANKSLTEVKQSVRQYKDSKNPDDLANFLLENLVLIEENSLKAAIYVSQKITEKYSYVSGLKIVIIGSAIHGGMAVREELGLVSDSDLDLGLIYDDSSQIDLNLLREISESIREIVREGHEQGLWEDLDEYTVNKFMNVERHHRLKPSNVDEAVNILMNINGSKSIENDNIMLLFSPVISEGEVNEVTLEIMLDALSKISIEDHEKWEELVTLLTESWSESHLLKDKHMNFRGSNQMDAQLSLVIEHWSPVHMSAAFYYLLRSTDRSTTSSDTF